MWGAGSGVGSREWCGEQVVVWGVGSGVGSR